MGIFGGLKNLGLGNMEGMDLYEEPKKEQEKQKPAAAAAPKIQEKDLIYDRSFVCPVCDSPIRPDFWVQIRICGPDMTESTR